MSSKYDRPIIYSPDIEGAIKAILDASYEMKNPYNDGFTQSIMKERLIKVQKEVNKALMDAPTFTGESER